MNKRIKKKKGLSKVTNEEVWDLDCTLAKYILPRLIKFKSVNTMSHPQQFNSIEEWHKVIDKMIWSFDKHLKDNFSLPNTPTYKDEVSRYKEGLQLFTEYFDDLWD
jgi:hypothetical protein